MATPSKYLSKPVNRTNQIPIREIEHFFFNYIRDCHFSDNRPMGYDGKSDQVPAIFHFSRGLYLNRNRITILGIAPSLK
jgi:hypothetical protein